MITPQELINTKANKIQHYCRDGFNTIQVIELMEDLRKNIRPGLTYKLKLKR